MNENAFFDAHSVCNPAEVLTLSADACGAIGYGCAHNRANLLRAGTLNCIVGPNDPRHPQNVDIVDIAMDDATLLKHVKEPPSQWWPLCGGPRPDGRPLVLHFNASDFSSLAKGISRIARKYPALRILIDPFKGGKASRWQAGVCLAEEPNIWITTRGLFAGDITWPERSEREALYFTVGEVGAGKLLFASGMTAAELDGSPLKPAEWLTGVAFLDAAERQLILRENAAELFAAFAPKRTIE